MSKSRLILCGGLQEPIEGTDGNFGQQLSLCTHGAEPNVNVRIEDVAKVFLEHLSLRLTDLLEIASYVYAADTAVSRGQGWESDGSEEKWRRRMQFQIPVREPDFWNSPETQKPLVTALNFLSDDQFEFVFLPIISESPRQEYLQYGETEDWPFYDVDRVIMFSGGLDSLAGAVDTASSGGNLVLVSHRSVGHMDKRQRDLFDKLKSTYDVPMLHIPIWVNKQEELTHETTQRTRSFLYSALGFVVARSVRAEGIRFFENGIVSLNLPVADEVIGARASRTTHPWALRLLSDLYSRVAEEPFEVDNPYLFMTKADVVQRIAHCGGARLVRYTCSCSHTLFRTKQQWHCGTCSQCIDRRVAVVAVGQEADESETDYVSDVFTGPRKEGYEQNMAVNYVRHAHELANMSEQAIASTFNKEISRAVRGVGDTRQAFADLVAMHQRHGETVQRVLQSQVEVHASDLVKDGLDPTSMLAKVVGQEHRKSAWVSYADRIHRLLGRGLPAMCKTTQPRNEPQLQEWCDGILKSNGEDLVREYPFHRWASALTKPDWSNDDLSLWIELKYVRKTAKPSVITAAIAEDITKYGDNQQRVLFLIYDPEHLVTDRDSVMADVERHEGMMIRFLP